MKLVSIFLSAVIVLSVGVFITFKNSSASLEEVNAQSKQTKYTIVLDAGHGGEDGGAVATDGTVEKDINLEFTKTIALFFDLFGIDYIQIRTEDISVCDDGLSTIRKRKTSDLLNREALVNSIENAILLSIHQNFYTESQYSGTQVFYSANTDESAILAREIQQNVKELLQHENTRETKASGDNIYLLYKAKQPAVLVECGFLSNKNELNNLKDNAYRSQLSYCIVKGLLNFIAQEDV